VGNSGENIQVTKLERPGTCITVGAGAYQQQRGAYLKGSLQEKIFYSSTRSKPWLTLDCLSRVSRLSLIRPHLNLFRIQKIIGPIEKGVGEVDR